MNHVHKKRVGVLRGGPSSEYLFSLSSGAYILEHLDKDKFIPVDLFIDKEGNWHVDGVVRSPYTTTQFVDIVFNALHGEYGEDGTVQTILEEIRKKHNGSDVIISKMTIDKHITKMILSQKGVCMPRGVRISPRNADWVKKTVEVWQTFHHPLIVKPTSSGSSVGVSLVKDYNALKHAVGKILEKGHTALIEEYIKGREVSVAVINDFRKKKHYVPIPLEILYDAPFFDNKTKKSGDFHVRPLKHFGAVEKKIIERLAVGIHSALGIKQYSQSDFIINEKGIYYLETNSLPGLSKNSILPKSLKESGISMKDFLTHVVESI